MKGTREKERISTVLFHVYTILENETSEMAEGRSVTAWGWDMVDGAGGGKDVREATGEFIYLDGGSGFTGMRVEHRACVIYFKYPRLTACLFYLHKAVQKREYMPKKIQNTNLVLRIFPLLEGVLFSYLKYTGKHLPPPL